MGKKTQILGVLSVANTARPALYILPSWQDREERSLPADVERGRPPALSLRRRSTWIEESGFGGILLVGWGVLYLSFFWCTNRNWQWLVPVLRSEWGAGVCERERGWFLSLFHTKKGENEWLQVLWTFDCDCVRGEEWKNSEILGSLQKKKKKWTKRHKNRKRKGDI
jgi:hypothetical protein